MTCSKCGNYIPDDSKFCQYCGETIDCNKKSHEHVQDDNRKTNSGPEKPMDKETIEQYKRILESAKKTLKAVTPKAIMKKYEAGEISEEQAMHDIRALKKSRHIVDTYPVIIKNAEEYLKRYNEAIAEEYQRQSINDEILFDPYEAAKLSSFRGLLIVHLLAYILGFILSLSKINISFYTSNGSSNLIPSLIGIALSILCLFVFIISIINPSRSTKNVYMIVYSCLVGSLIWSLYFSFSLRVKYFYKVYTNTDNKENKDALKEHRIISAISIAISSFWIIANVLLSILTYNSVGYSI